MSNPGPLGLVEPLTIHFDLERVGFFDLHDPFFAVVDNVRDEKSVRHDRVKLTGGNQRLPAVYVIVLNDTAIYYVGQTGNLLRRMRTHRTRPGGVRSGLQAEAARGMKAKGPNGPYMGAELLLSSGTFIQRTTLQRDSTGNNMEQVRHPHKLVLTSLHNRLLLEAATLFSLRNHLPTGAAINAV